MIRLVSLNIERSKHLDLVIPFLREQNADVVCLQELMEKDIPVITEALGMDSVLFTHMTDIVGEGQFGTGIVSRLSVRASGIEYYVYHDKDGPRLNVTVPSTFNNEDRAFSWCDIEHGGVLYRIGTTHFTWTPDGLSSPQQHTDMRALLALLSRQDEFVLCGDFNAPRGGEIFAMLTEKYKDNIPPHYKTSIDVNLHRAGHLPSEKMDQKMVDGLFTAPAYSATDVELHSGVSDHLAITATITKQESA